MSKKKYNILITGYYFKKNYGDDLLLDVAKKLLTPKYCSGVSFNTQIIGIDRIDNNNISELCNWSDKIILFGGEVINDYFLDKLISMKQYAFYNYKKNIKLYAIGVSCNTVYSYITNKLDIFEVIVFRNDKDYSEFLPRLTNYYSKSLPDPVFLLKPEKKNTGILARLTRKDKQISVAFFLSQTVKPTDEYIQNIANLIRHWQFHGALVYLLTMCNNDLSKTENDILINTAVYEQLNFSERENIILIDNPALIFNYLQTIDYAVCWRFHSHIFCIQYGIPFLSISNTPKVINILNENGLTDLSYIDKNLINGINYLIENKSIIKKKLNIIASDLLEKAQSYKKWGNFIFRERNIPRFYIDTKNPLILPNIIKEYLKFTITNDHEFNSRLLIYLITGKINSNYEWGLMKKMEDGQTPFTLVSDLEWLINEHIKNGPPAFYYKMAHYLEINSLIFEKNRGKFLNIHYIDQNDMRGVHRSGWQYVIDGIEKELGTFYPAAILCDLYLDRTFHWNYETNERLGIIPYTKQWIGFIHHTGNTTYSNYNIIEMFKKELFLKSLLHCKALIVLSNYLKSQIQIILKKLGYTGVHVYNLHHPTEIIEESRCFDYNTFINMPIKRIVQVGAWYRDIGAIFKLTLGSNPLKYNRYALKGPNMESYYTNNIQSKIQISRDKTIRGGSNSIQSIAYALERPVEILEKLDDKTYDDLLKTSIIFIKLLDCSAVNTIIEAIVRNTPILVNPLDAVVEYLGKDYPFYYNTLEEAAKKANDPYLIRKAYFYLKKKDKTCLKIETFIQSLRSLKIFESMV